MIFNFIIYFCFCKISIIISSLFIISSKLLFFGSRTNGSCSWGSNSADAASGCTFAPADAPSTGVDNSSPSSKCSNSSGVDFCRSFHSLTFQNRS